MKYTKTFTLTISILMFLNNILIAQQPDYKNPSLPVAKRIASLLSEMTIEEKISEMTSNGVIHDEHGYLKQ